MRHWASAVRQEYAHTTRSRRAPDHSLFSGLGIQPMLGRASDAMSSTLSSLRGTASSMRDKASNLVTPGSKPANTVVVDSPLTESPPPASQTSQPTPPLQAASEASPASPASSAASWAGSAMAWATSLGAVKWLIIIVVLAFLGLNVFAGLGKATGGAAEVLRPLLASIGMGVGDTVKSTVQASAAGTKGIVDATAGTVTGGVDVIEKRIDGGESERSGVAPKRAGQGGDAAKRGGGPAPDQAGSSTQATKPTKGGYCYIGEDRGYRSCLKVNNGSMCESGEIFPTMAKCTDPAVRDTQATH